MVTKAKGRKAEPKPTVPPGIRSALDYGQKNLPGMLLIYKGLIEESPGDYSLLDTDAQLAANVLKRPCRLLHGLFHVIVFPHELEDVLSKLLSAGHRVALCEKTPEPQPMNWISGGKGRK